MFRALSRRVDRRTFTDIDNWLLSKGYRTDLSALDDFITSSKGSSPKEFFDTNATSQVKLERLESYPFNYLFSFPSPRPSGDASNDVVRGDFYPNFSLNAPAAIVFSGWLETATDYSRLAHRVGLVGRNLWAMDLPYHARRTPEGTKSGELSITGDLVRTLQTLRQAVIDARALIKALSASGIGDIAVVGFSLGAWVGSLLALVEPSISKLILATPVVRPDKLLLSSPLFTSLRSGIDGKRGDDLFENLSHLYIPARGKPLVDNRGIHLLGSVDDPLAPPWVVKELSRSWKCRSKILPGGHITLYVTPRLWKNIFYLLSANDSLL
jgi:pimeloyl-ACP methyl ester carboxylesterase